jgi:hypothetical protein
LAAVFFLIVGVFLPFIRLPFVGSINYFNNGGGDGVIVLILAGVSLYAVLRRRFRVLWATGLLSAALTVFTVFRMLHSISKFGAEMQNKAGGNLFAGLAQSVQLDYGVAVIAVGIILTLVTAGYRENSQPIA